ncbi:unnamed protein product [Mytilus edulis]|uniref:Uncharacterized protein n=1 Tax=Mytilus edulis TaxID=6550 RepID=A0A8S3R278_MYTED|nr:unnamed protein product [Mytilus edulis]
MNLKPSDIHFSQDSISNTFGKKTQHRNTYIGETLDELINGTATVFSIPTISVFQHKGKWFTSDNRRLWVFRKAEELGILRSIPVSENLLSMIGIKNPKLNTKNGGLSVSVRGNDPGGHTWRRLIEERSRNQYHNSTHHSNRMEETNSRYTTNDGSSWYSKPLTENHSYSGHSEKPRQYYSRLSTNFNHPSFAERGGSQIMVIKEKTADRKNRVHVKLI